jgi:hypothetical protein
MWMMHLSKWQTERTPRYCSFSFFVLFDKATTVDDSEYHGDDILKILGHVGACLGWYLPWLDSNFPCMTTALVCSDKLKEEVDRPHMAPCYTCPLFIQTTWSRQDFKLSTEIKPGMELLCMLLRNTFVRHEKSQRKGGTKCSVDIIPDVSFLAKHHIQTSQQKAQHEFSFFCFFILSWLGLGHGVECLSGSGEPELLACSYGTMKWSKVNAMLSSMLSLPK